MPAGYPYFQAVFERIAQRKTTTTIGLRPLEEEDGRAIFQSPAHLRRPYEPPQKRARQGVHGPKIPRVSTWEKRQILARLRESLKNPHSLWSFFAFIGNPTSNNIGHLRHFALFYNIGKNPQETPKIRFYQFSFFMFFFSHSFCSLRCCMARKIRLCSLWKKILCRQVHPITGFTMIIGERMGMREEQERAEGVGFEPTRAFWTLPIFKTGAFNRSAIPPRGRSYTAFLDFERGYGEDVAEA